MLCTRACCILVVTIIIMKKHKCKNMNVEFSKGARIKEKRSKTIFSEKSDTSFCQWPALMF